MQAKLYVGNLAHATTEADLRTLFNQAGTVRAVDVIIDHDSGQSKGFAFVTMSSPDEAEKAISMLNAFSIHDRELRVNLAGAREDRGSQPTRPRAFSGGRPRRHKPRGGNRRY